MGFGTWQASVALLTGLVAKEAVVASLSMFYGFNLNAASSAVAAALGGTSPPLGRVRVFGIRPFVCSLCRGGRHHTQGDGQLQMDRCLRGLADHGRLYRFADNISDRSHILPRLNIRE